MLLLALLPILIFGRALWFDFSPLDEDWLIIKNEAFLQDWRSAFTVFVEPTNDIYFRPFHFASFIFDYHLGGTSPFFYHLTNLVLHLLNLILMFKLLVQYKVSHKISFALVFLFSFHPILLGSVAWIPGRNDELLSIFFISGMLAQTNYLRYGNLKYLILNNLAFIGALLTKETAIILPVIYFLNGYVAGNKWQTVFLKNILPMGIIGVIWFLIRRSIVGELPHQNTDVIEHITNFGKVMLIYFGKSVIPVQQSVFPTIMNTSILPGIITVSILLIVVVFGQFHNKRLALFGLFIFLVLLILPVWFMSNSMSREQYENRIYTSMFGMLIFVSQIKLNVHPGILKGVFFVFALVYLGLNFIRMNYYSSQINFLTQSVEDNPGNYFFQSRMGDHYFFLKDYKKAIEHYDKAIQIQPNKPMFFNNRANAFAFLGNKVNAIRDFESALALSNNDPGIRINKCMTLLDFKEVHLATIELFKLKTCCQDRIPPDVEKKIIALWNKEVYAKITERIKGDPNNAVLYANRAKLFYDLGIYVEAAKDLSKAIELDPANGEYRGYLQMVKVAGKLN